MVLALLSWVWGSLLYQTINATPRRHSRAVTRLAKSDLPTVTAYTDSTPTDTLQAPTDNTTNNATTGHHGFLPKLSGDSGTFLNGLGSFASVEGSGTGSTPTSLSGGYASMTSSTTITYAPDTSNSIYFYESSAWVLHTIPDSGATIAATGLSASTVYYLYGYDGGNGVCALNLVTTAPTTQNGIRIKTGSTNYLLLAYCYANASGAITTYVQDASTQLICNVYNKRPIGLYKTEATANWTYAVNTWRSLRNTAANKFDIVCDGQSFIQALGSLLASGTSAGDCIGFGIDSTSVNSAQAHPLSAAGGSGVGGAAVAIYTGKPAVGYHYVQILERAYSTATATVFGTSTTYGNAGFCLTGHF